MIGQFVLKFVGHSHYFYLIIYFYFYELFKHLEHILIIYF